MKEKYRRTETLLWVDNLSRRYAGTDQLWPEISNPIAREVVRTAYRMLPADTTRGPAFDDPENCPMSIHDYQMWLRERLENSGLGKGLAGGAALLPDATAHLPWPWRYLAQKYGPRSYRQLTRMLIRNLEWYVDQSRVLRDPWTIAGEQLPLSALFTLMLLASLWMSTPLRGAGWFLVVLAFLLIFAFCFSIQLIWGGDSHKYKTNCAEFYRYVVREYSDSEQLLPQHDFDLHGLRRLGQAPGGQIQP